jgi:hypothetical protein
MFGFWPRPRFDSDTLSSIWVMVCRDESPVLTAFSVAFRLRGITPEEVIELVKSRQELFRLGLTRGQSRGWKARFQQTEPTPKPAPAQTASRRRKAAPKAQPYPLPDWLQVFDDEGPAGEQERVREWLNDKSITSSQQALDNFLDERFVIDEIAFRSQFRIDPKLEAEPSDLATVNWGLEHIERLRRGRAETRQSVVALTTGIGGVAIGAMVALTAPMVTTLYQGRPADTARFTVDHQKRLDGYGSLGKATVAAAHAVQSGDDGALKGSLTDISEAATILSLLVDPATRKELQGQQTRTVDACAPDGAQGAAPAEAPCLNAIRDLQHLINGPLADLAGR